MAKTFRITLHVKFAWWLRLYVACIAFVSTVSGLEPDYAKLERMILRGIQYHTRMEPD